jgi:spermidine/putrescine transport system permease protein
MKGFLAAVISGFLLLLVSAPLITMLVVSLCVERYPRFPWPGWSFQWYSGLFADRELLGSLGQSALVGCCAAVLCCAVGFCGAYSLSGGFLRRTSVPLALAALPSLLPMVVFGFCFLQLAQAFGFARTPAANVLAHAAVFSPISVFLLFYALQKLNRSVEDAARELGASETRIATQIVALQIWPAIVASLIISFVLSWDEYVISWFVSGFQKTYPVYVRNMLESTMTPEIDAAGILVAAASILLAYVAWRLFRRVA